LDRPPRHRAQAESSKSSEAERTGVVRSLSPLLPSLVEQSASSGAMCASSSTVQGHQAFLAPYLQRASPRPTFAPLLDSGPCWLAVEGRRGTEEDHGTPGRLSTRALSVVVAGFAISLLWSGAPGSGGQRNEGDVSDLEQAPSSNTDSVAWNGTTHLQPSKELLERRS
jgi:hypothetical protein